MIMPSLLLQKCSRNSKDKNHTESLKRTLKLWKEGQFDGLVREVRLIQKFNMAKKFNNFMLSGKVNAALRLLSDIGSAGILPTSKQTIDLLKEKHSVGAPNH